MSKPKISIKKTLVFCGKDRVNFNISIKICDFLIKNSGKDHKFHFVVTDNDKKIVSFLRKKKQKFYLKGKLKYLFKNIKNGEYDWLLNIWGHYLFPKYFLNKFNNNLNIHPSYLPYGKGKDASLWTVIKNYPAGTTLHKMSEKIDDGPIFCHKRFKFSFPAIGRDIYERSIKDSMSLFFENWKKIKNLKMPLKMLKPNNIKPHYRSEMIRENLVDLDNYKNKEIKKFIIKSLAHDFYPNFTLKIKYKNKIYLYRSKIK